MEKLKLTETFIKSLKKLFGNGIELLPGLLSAIILVMLTRYIAQFGKNWANTLVKKTIDSKSLQVLFSKTTYITIWVIGISIACVLAFPGLNLGHIISTLGLGSVAIGFALQDIFKNFLAGILLLLEEPFKIGDHIIVENYQGIVEYIDIRTTKILTYQGERILVPNAIMFTSKVQIKTAFESRRTDLAIGVDYNTSLPQAKTILLQSIQETEGVLSKPLPEIDLVSFSATSIDFLVRYWTKPQEKIVRQVTTRVILAIKKNFDEANIKIL